jgi:hypothetical protein
MSSNKREYEEALAGFLSVGLMLGGASLVLFAVAFLFHHGTSRDNYRKSFDRTMECRERVKISTNIDAICGKIPQWSEFIKEEK